MVILVQQNKKLPMVNIMTSLHILMYTVVYKLCKRIEYLVNELIENFYVKELQIMKTTYLH